MPKPAAQGPARSAQLGQHGLDRGGHPQSEKPPHTRPARQCTDASDPSSTPPPLGALSLPCRTRRGADHFPSVILPVQAPKRPWRGRAASRHAGHPAVWALGPCPSGSHPWSSQISPETLEGWGQPGPLSPAPLGEHGTTLHFQVPRRGAEPRRDLADSKGPANVFFQTRVATLRLTTESLPPSSAQKCPLPLLRQTALVPKLCAPHGPPAWQSPRLASGGWEGRTVSVMDCVGPNPTVLC